jgi:hypothetical protein
MGKSAFYDVKYLFFAEITGKQLFWLQINEDAIFDSLILKS